MSGIGEKPFEVGIAVRPHSTPVTLAATYHGGEDITTDEGLVVSHVWSQDGLLSFAHVSGAFPATYFIRV